MSTTIDHTAIGTALGFSFQFDRGTYRLLSGDVAVVAVGFEDLDDVSEHRLDGTTVREQDKSSIRQGHALTDHSAALWKSLGTWCNEVATDRSVLPTTSFQLVTNGAIKANGLAAEIHAVDDATAAKALARRLRQVAASLRDDLRPHGDAVRGLPLNISAELLTRVTVVDRTSTRFGGDLAELPSLRLFTPQQRIALFDQAVGWFRREVRRHAEEGCTARIRREDLEREVRAAVRGLQAAPLGSVLVPPSVALTPSEHAARGFVLQLAWVDSGQDLMREALIHHTQAEATRTRWTDDGLVSEAALQAYQDDLKSRWQRICRQVGRRQHGSKIVEGQERLDAALAEDTVLLGEQMPKAISCGNFHVLADFDRTSRPGLGWHPDFDRMASGDQRK